MSAPHRAATGPLHLLKSNTRYFTDGSGRAIFLTGTHNWNNFQDTGHRADTGHLCGHVCGDNVWVWKSSTRGLNVLFMEELTPSPTWHDSARVGMGQVRLFCERVNLAELTPHEALASTAYCLAKPGLEYVVFQPGGRGEFSVNLSDGAGAFAAEWLDVNRDTTSKGETVEGGEHRVFRTPFPGPAVLYLKSTGASR